MDPETVRNAITEKAPSIAHVTIFQRSPAKCLPLLFHLSCVTYGNAWGMGVEAGEKVSYFGASCFLSLVSLSVIPLQAFFYQESLLGSYLSAGLMATPPVRTVSNAPPPLILP